jgi:hypothetical protein
MALLLAKAARGLFCLHREQRFTPSLSDNPNSPAETFE